MIITCDRQDGIFTPQMSDRINVKSTALWERIQDINVTPIYPKIAADTEHINTTGIPIVSYVVDNSIVVGNHLHIINFTITFNGNVSYNSFGRIANLNVAPITDILVQFYDGKYVLYVEKGTTEIKILGNVGTQAQIYFYYVV